MLMGVWNKPLDEYLATGVSVGGVMSVGYTFLPIFPLTILV
jgi:hypothetical protein